MILFIHAAERENAFLMLVWEHKEFLKNKATQQSKELLAFLTFDDYIVFEKRITYRGKKAPDILAAIDALLCTFDSKPEDLAGVCVLSGPGQFSFLRTGIIVANTFGWALDIPVVGISGGTISSEKDFVIKGMKRLARKKRFVAVMPEYGKEPNITVAKRKI
ncbi:MAG: hypothetical protein AAB855_02010 [Patescibacteria group bacterium]